MAFTNRLRLSVLKSTTVPWSSPDDSAQQCHALQQLCHTTIGNSKTGTTYVEVRELLQDIAEGETADGAPDGVDRRLPLRRVNRRQACSGRAQ